MKDLGAALLQSYPDANPSPLGTDYQVRDEGQGPFLAAWDDKVLGPRPSDDDLARLVDDYVAPAPAVPPAKILAALKAMDPAKAAAIAAAIDPLTLLEFATATLVKLDDERLVAALTAAKIKPADLVAALNPEPKE